MPEAKSTKRKASSEPSLNTHHKEVEPSAKHRNTTQSGGAVLSLFVVSGLPEDATHEEGELGSGATAVIVADSEQQVGDILFKEFYPSAAKEGDSDVAEQVGAKVSEWLQSGAEVPLENDGLYDLTNGITQKVRSAATEKSADARVEKSKRQAFVFRNFKSQSLRPSAALVVARDSATARKMLLKHIGDTVKVDLRPESLVTDNWLGDEGEVETVETGEPGFYHLRNGSLYSE